MAEGLHIYIHIPFCKRKCAYCSFTSLAGNTAYIPVYFDALEQEIIRTIPLLDHKTINTIYVGGGTPSCVPAERIAAVIDLLRSYLPLRRAAEITVECNPHSLKPVWIDTLLTAGVNRFSLGVQSLNDSELSHLGRLHDALRAKAAYTLLRDRCSAALSIDLMYGIPGQTKQSWEKSLYTIVDDWQPDHISLYGLSIDPGTQFSRWKKTGKKGWNWPDDDTMMDWYWLAADTLNRNEYTRYEISNYAQPGYESRHNLCYWDTAAEYIGFGAAAHSYCMLNTGKKRRFRTIKSIPSYIERIQNDGRFRVFSRPLSQSALLGEELLLGLRRTAGVKIRDDHRKLFATVIERQLKDGLIYFRSRESIALTHRGVEIANMVMSEYV